MYVFFWLCPFFYNLLQYKALTLTYTWAHAHTHVLQEQQQSARWRSLLLLSSNQMHFDCFVSYNFRIRIRLYALSDTLTLFVSALNLVNYCFSVPIRDEQFLNTIFVDSLCLQFLHTHIHLSLLPCMCVCVSVREQSAVCVCLPPLVVNALLPFHTFLLFFLSSIANHTVACFQLHLLLCDTCPLCRNKFTLLLTIASFCLQTFVCVCVSICCFELLLEWPDCK